MPKEIITFGITHKKRHLVSDWPGLTQAGRMNFGHMVPKQNTRHLIIGWPGQTKSVQMKYHHLVAISQTIWTLVTPNAR